MSDFSHSSYSAARIIVENNDINSIDEYLNDDDYSNKLFYLFDNSIRQNNIDVLNYIFDELEPKQIQLFRGGEGLYAVMRYLIKAIVLRNSKASNNDTAVFDKMLAYAKTHNDHIRGYIFDFFERIITIKPINIYLVDHIISSVDEDRNKIITYMLKNTLQNNNSNIASHICENYYVDIDRTLIKELCRASKTTETDDILKMYGLYMKLQKFD